MKRTITLYFCFFLLIFNSKFLIFNCSAQSGYQIRVKNEIITADSLFVYVYNVKEKKFTPFHSLKFEKDITLKNSIPLDAGIYTLVADSMMLGEFIISDPKKQKFTISFNENDVEFEGSIENSANHEYMKQMMEFSHQMSLLNMEFQQMQQKELPNSMMQVYMDTFFMKLDTLNWEKRSYQEKVISENKGTLLASIIQCSMEVPPPPPDYYRNQIQMLTYLSSHFFDSFTWDDERLLKTPVLYNKFKTFVQQISYLDSEITIPIVVKALGDSKKNKDLYFALFDFIELYFGNYKSPEMRNEQLYLAMLHDILTIPDLEETKRQRYEYEINILDRNLPDTQAIDFNILLSNGDTTSLYSFEAEYLILYFQNPDCPTCSEFREKLKNIEVLYHAINSGKLKVMTVYFESNEELWRNYLEKKAFKNWIHAWNYDLQISENHLYDVRVIPTIMILDKNKKVIKKDIFPDELEEWIKRNL